MSTCGSGQEYQLCPCCHRSLPVWELFSFCYRKQLGSAFAENQAGRKRQVPRKLLRWELVVSQVLICHGHVGGPHAGRVLWRRGGAVRTRYSSLLRQPQIIQPAFPSGDAGSTPKDSTNFGSNQSYWKKKNPELRMSVPSGFLLLFLLLI